MFKQLRRTKIVITLGPTTDINNNLEKVIIAGANVVRLNFSHGSSQEHILRAKKVREIADRFGKHIAIIGDLQGPKIRISTFKNGKVFLKVGDKFLLDANIEHGKGDNKQVGVNYKGLYTDVQPDNILLLDDGRIQLKVLKIQKTKIFTEVIIGGILSNNKGINKLGGGLSAKALTEKDKLDIIVAAKIGVDYLAISFPRASYDIDYARQLAYKAGSNAKIVSKIERAEIISSNKTIDDIIMASDVIMVARGDLGVEIGDSELIGIQKKLIHRAHILNKTVIIATQMMESMIRNAMPTRAEVMDVANAVLDGTDAVMLSAETAIGQYPYETVTTMSSVCLGAEKISSTNNKYKSNRKFNSIEEAIAVSVMYTANRLKGVTAIISITDSGQTLLIMSRINSKLPIFALSRHEYILNLVSLYRGVIPISFTKKYKGFIAAKHAVNLLKKKGFLILGDLVVVTQSDFINLTDTNNISRILLVE